MGELEKDFEVKSYLTCKGCRVVGLQGSRVAKLVQVRVKTQQQ
jgi:hypothetical protein